MQIGSGIAEYVALGNRSRVKHPCMQRRQKVGDQITSSPVCAFFAFLWLQFCFLASCQRPSNSSSVVSSNLRFWSRNFSSM